MIASINLPHSSYKTKLVEFSQTIWKIPLTFFVCLSVYQLGVLATGFILVAIRKQPLFFPRYQGQHRFLVSIFGFAICGVGYGILGGIFGRLLAKVSQDYHLKKWRGWVRQHPIYIAYYWV